MQGVSTKVTAATLVQAVLVIAAWVVFDLFRVEAFPQPVLDAVQVLATFGAGYLVSERASLG